ncbi:hypothetical protein PENTCL1PPCAC_5313, partial [Pristionchus entomophagus]
LQHPLETLDAASLIHSTQTGHVEFLTGRDGQNLRKIRLGNHHDRLVHEVKRLKGIVCFEHRRVILQSLKQLPLLQINELRLNIVDDGVTRSALADHLVNGKNLKVLHLNVHHIGMKSFHNQLWIDMHNLFTERSYNRRRYSKNKDWMIPNVKDGEPDPITLCIPSIAHLATNVANVKLFWQLRDYYPPPSSSFSQSGNTEYAEGIHHQQRIVCGYDGVDGAQVARFLRAARRFQDKARASDAPTGRRCRREQIAERNGDSIRVHL